MCIQNTMLNYLANLVIGIFIWKPQTSLCISKVIVMSEGLSLCLPMHWTPAIQKCYIAIGCLTCALSDLPDSHVPWVFGI